MSDSNGVSPSISLTSSTPPSAGLLQPPQAASVGGVHPRVPTVAAQTAAAMVYNTMGQGEPAGADVTVSGTCDLIGSA